MSETKAEQARRLAREQFEFRVNAKARMEQAVSGHERYLTLVDVCGEEALLQWRKDNPRFPRVGEASTPPRSSPNMHGFAPRGLHGFALAFMPRSWAVGRWTRPHKVAYAFGPFRFIRYLTLKPWKSYEGESRH